MEAKAHEAEASLSTIRSREREVLAESQELRHRIQESDSLAAWLKARLAEAEQQLEVATRRVTELTETLKSSGKARVTGESGRRQELHARLAELEVRLAAHPVSDPSALAEPERDSAADSTAGVEGS